MFTMSEAPPRLVAAGVVDGSRVNGLSRRTVTGYLHYP